MAIRSRGIDEDDALSDEELNVFWAEKAQQLDWAFTYRCCSSDHDRCSLGSTRTPSGRRRCFNVAMGNERNDKFSGFVTAVVLEMCNKPKPAGEPIWQSLLRNTDFPPQTLSGGQTACVRESKLSRPSKVATVEALKLELIRGAVMRFGFEALDGMFRRAAAGCVRGLKNAHRNHPIQGAVADVTMHAFAKLIKELPEGARPIISVHDSVTIECREEDADAVAKLLNDSVMEAMAIFCSTCPAKVDVDIRTSLSDDDVVREYSEEPATSA